MIKLALMTLTLLALVFLEWLCKPQLLADHIPLKVPTHKHLDSDPHNLDYCDPLLMYHMHYLLHSYGSLQNLLHNNPS